MKTLNDLIENLILAREGKIELNLDFRKAEEDVRWILRGKESKLFQ